MTADDDGAPGASLPPVPEAPPAPTTAVAGDTAEMPATTAVMDAPPGPPSGPLPARRRRRRWIWILVVLVVAVVAVASRVNLDYYAIQPGSAQSVQQFIAVPPARNHPVRHPVLLTDVEIGRVTALSYLFFRAQGDTDLAPVGSVVGPFPPSQLGPQGDLEMSQAEAAAKTAALSRLGYTVVAHAAGAVVFGTFPGTPAASALQVGDVITAVDGAPVTSAAGLTHTLERYHSGQTVTFSVRRGGTGTPQLVPITLRTTRVDVGGGQQATLLLGVAPEDQVDYRYPFPVRINVNGIGGPSAGLAMTLGVMDALTNGAITGGHTVAATGTIAADGGVGEVGGVPQKTVAVEDAHASIFLVPAGQNYQQARGKDRPGLGIYPVSTLDQALAVLAAHGGGVGPTAAAPVVTTGATGSAATG